MEKRIPTHDPHTGDLNPYYEEITGDKNPFSIENNNDNHCFDLSTLIGREFKHRGKYGLSIWTDKVKSIEPNMGIYTNLQESLKPIKEGEKPKKFKVIGHFIDLYVRSAKGNHLYKLKNCIFVEEI
jgi:hypothetical protein